MNVGGDLNEDIINYSNRAQYLKQLETDCNMQILTAEPFANTQRKDCSEIDYFIVSKLYI